MRSISFRLFAMIASILLVLLFILNVFPIISSRDMIIDAKAGTLSSQCSVISSSLSSLETLSRDSVKEVMQILDIRGYDRISVFGADGQLLYDFGNSSAPLPDPGDLSTALSGKTIFRSAFTKNAFSSSYMMPISFQGLMTGIVYLYEYDSSSATIIFDLQSMLKSLSFIISFIALLFAAVFSFSLYRRLHSMTDSMRIVGNGDYSHRLETKGRDELTALGQEFNSLTERLQSNEQQRRQFVADASHELKTPLASIRLLSDSIVQNEGIDTETIREFVSDIGNEANRLQRTTEKLLDLSRLDDSSVQVTPEPVDMQQVTMDALAVLQPLAEEKHVQLLPTLEEGCVVMANTDDMFHILFNLMENAVKYNVEGGTVWIRLSETEDTVVFSVSDTGIGIPESDRLNIFSRFYRVDKARSREAGGSGLGLSIVHDAVLAHNGTISVGARRPQGSVFTVSFPRPTSEETGI